MASVKWEVDITEKQTSAARQNIWRRPTAGLLVGAVEKFPSCLKLKDTDVPIVVELPILKKKLRQACPPNNEQRLSILISNPQTAKPIWIATWLWLALIVIIYVVSENQ